MGLMRKILFWPLVWFLLLGGLALWKGGEVLRWVGDQSARWGQAIQETTREAAETTEEWKASLQEKKEALQKGIEEVVRSAEELGILRRETGEDGP